MSKKTFLNLLCLTLYAASISVLWIKVSGFAALGVFLIVWAHNIELKNSK